ncbi:hypothetical protein BD779DRAFT_1483043 [Infundibulicybe gibba]|nr:hypothetical protein BD779DRAFT_1483043 [Infundibulicybe gibba]
MPTVHRHPPILPSKYLANVPYTPIGAAAMCCEVRGGMRVSGDDQLRHLPVPVVSQRTRSGGGGVQASEAQVMDSEQKRRIRRRCGRGWDVGKGRDWTRTKWRGRMMEDEGELGLGEKNVPQNGWETLSWVRICTWVQISIGACCGGCGEMGESWTLSASTGVRWALRIPCSQTGPSPPLCTSLPDSLQRYSADPSASILVGRSKHTPLAIARKDTNGTLEVLSSNPLLTCKMRGRKLCNSSTSPMASAWLIWTHQWWCIREHDEPLQLRRVACGTAYSSHAPPPGARPGDEQHENGMFACAIAWGKISNANDSKARRANDARTIRDHRVDHRPGYGQEDERCDNGIHGPSPGTRPEGRTARKRYGAIVRVRPDERYDDAATACASVMACTRLTPSPPSRLRLPRQFDARSDLARLNGGVNRGLCSNRWCPCLRIALAMSPGSLTPVHLRLLHQFDLCRHIISGPGLQLAQVAAEQLDPAVLQGILPPGPPAMIGLTPDHFNPNIDVYNDRDILRMITFYNEDFEINALWGRGADNTTADKRMFSPGGRVRSVPP